MIYCSKKSDKTKVRAISIDCFTCLFSWRKRWDERTKFIGLLAQNKARISYQAQHSDDSLFENEWMIKSKGRANRLFYLFIFMKERRWGNMTKLIVLLVQNKVRIDYQMQHADDLLFDVSQIEWKNRWKKNILCCLGGMRRHT